MATSAYFDEATLKRDIVPKKSPKKTTKAAAPAPVEAAPKAAPVIADKKIAEEVEAFRAFFKTEIEPLTTAIEVSLRGDDATSVQVSKTLGLWVAKNNLRNYRENSRLATTKLSVYRGEHLAAFFCASLIDNDLDEFSALVSNGFPFHDDRGDGFLYVPAFHSRHVLNAWERAAAALGIDTKCRPCMR